MERDQDYFPPQNEIKMKSQFHVRVRMRTIFMNSFPARIKNSFEMERRKKEIYGTQIEDCRWETFFLLLPRSASVQFFLQVAVVVGAVAV